MKSSPIFSGCFFCVCKYYAVPAKFVVGTGKLLWGRLQAFGNPPKVFRLKCELFQNRKDLTFPLSVNSQSTLINRNATAVPVPTTNFAYSILESSVYLALDI